MDTLAPVLFLLGGLLIAVSVVWYLRLWMSAEGDAAATQRPLPRLFLLGFTLAVVTGPLVLWLVITNQEASRAPEAAAGSIGRILCERLPEPAEQAARHAELIEAIRGIGHPQPSAPWQSGAGVRLAPRLRLPRGAEFLALASSLLLLAAGWIVLANLEGVLGKLLGTVVVLGSVAVLGVSLPDLLTFDPIHDVPPRRLPAASAPEMPAAQPAELAFEPLVRLGPFPSARHAGDEESIRPQLQEALPRIRAWGADDRLGFLLLVGGADMRPLAWRAQQAYGSNAGLAQARAEWVKLLLIEMAGGQLDPGRVVTLIAGPENVGVDAPAGELARDRCVRLYGCWVPAD